MSMLNWKKAGLFAGGVLFGTAVCGGCVPGAGLCSAADCEFSACVDSFSALTVAVLSVALSLLSETEADELSSGSVRWIISAETVSCEELSVVCGFSVFVHPEKERISAVKTAIPIAFLIFANLPCSFIVRIPVNFCKGVSRKRNRLSLFSGSTGSFEGERCGEGEQANTATPCLILGYSNPLLVRRRKLHIARFTASGKSSLIPLLLLSPKSLRLFGNPVIIFPYLFASCGRGPAP